jgi:hypothetical protein
MVQTIPVKSLAVRPAEGKVELVLVASDLEPFVFELDEPKVRLLVIDLFNVWVH